MMSLLLALLALAVGIGVGLGYVAWHYWAAYRITRAELVGARRFANVRVIVESFAWTDTPDAPFGGLYRLRTVRHLDMTAEEIFYSAIYGGGPFEILAPNDRAGIRMSFGAGPRPAHVDLVGLGAAYDAGMRAGMSPAPGADPARFRLPYLPPEGGQDGG